MAEILIKAKDSWLSQYTPAQIDAMGEKIKKAYNRRGEVGDVVAIRPDGWEWGKEETLPNFILLKVTDLDYETAKDYEGRIRTSSISDLTEGVEGRRKFTFPAEKVLQYVNNQQPIVTVTKEQLKTFIRRNFERASD